MFYVYILESVTTGKWYYGFTERLEKRIQEHNSKNGHFTGNKRPWRLIFKRVFEDNSKALAFEKTLKQLKNKEYIRRVYSIYFI